jgi:hypothetical protein
MQTGQRYPSIQKQDFIYGDILGRGNGGMVRAGVHKQSGIPVAIKVSYFGVIQNVIL